MLERFHLFSNICCGFSISSNTENKHVLMERPRLSNRCVFIAYSSPKPAIAYVYIYIYIYDYIYIYIYIYITISSFSTSAFGDNNS